MSATTTTTTQYTYTGTNRRGTAQGGVLTSVDLAEFVVTRFRRGWRHLVVFAPDDKVNPIAEIGRDLFTGRPTYWYQVSS